MGVLSGATSADEASDCCRAAGHATLGATVGLASRRLGWLIEEAAARFERGVGLRRKWESCGCAIVLRADSTARVGGADDSGGSGPLAVEASGGAAASIRSSSRNCFRSFVQSQTTSDASGVGRGARTRAAAEVGTLGGPTRRHRRTLWRRHRRQSREQAHRRPRCNVGDEIRRALGARAEAAPRPRRLRRRRI